MQPTSTSLILSNPTKSVLTPITDLPIHIKAYGELRFVDAMQFVLDITPYEQPNE